MDQDLNALLLRNKHRILEIASQYGAHNIRVFGSVARGDWHAASDLDLVVDFEQGRSLLDHVALKQHLEDLLGVRVDVINESGLYHAIRDQVLKEAVPV